MTPDLIISNYKEYINKDVFGWNVIDCVDIPGVYIIVLNKENKERIFYIRRTIVKAKDIFGNEDYYELWDKDYEEAKLLTTTEIFDINVVLNKIGELLQKYSKYN
jgi:hypothetical protein